MVVANMCDCALMTFQERAKMIEKFYEENKDFRGLDFYFSKCAGRYSQKDDVVFCSTKCPHYRKKEIAC